MGFSVDICPVSSAYFEPCPLYVKNWRNYDLSKVAKFKNITQFSGYDLGFVLVDIITHSWSFGGLYSGNIYSVDVLRRESFEIGQNCRNYDLSKMAKFKNITQFSGSYLGFVDTITANTIYAGAPGDCTVEIYIVQLCNVEEFLKSVEHCRNYDLSKMANFKNITQFS